MTAARSDGRINQHIVRISDIANEPCQMLMPIVGYEDMPIVPLEIAVEPLVSFLPTVQSHAYVAKERCQKPPADGLTIDESASIMLYSMSWKPRNKCLYFVLNETLRSDDRDQLEPWFLYLKLFFTALERLPSVHRTVYRGGKLDLANYYPKGKSIVWWGFSSCTTSIDILQSELLSDTTTTTKTMFRIECYTGKDIQKHLYFPFQEEILLFPATQFKIVACLNRGSGLHRIQLEEITPPFPLRQSVLGTSSELPLESTPTTAITTTITTIPNIEIVPQLDDDYATTSVIDNNNNNVLVWLDSNINDIQGGYQIMIRKLRRIIETIHTFTDFDQCINFLVHDKDEHIFLIISGALGERFISDIHDMSHVKAIFIFCGDKARHEEWACNWIKIKGVYTEINDLRRAIRQAIDESDQNTININFTTTDNQSSNERRDQLDPDFMCTQILKEIFLDIDFTEEHIKDFLVYCRREFMGNYKELQNCDKIEREYADHTPIWWYTYECFLYRMVARAINTTDITLMTKMGFFIRDLHRHIEQIHSEQLHRQISQPFLVYRGQGMTEIDFNQLRKNKGGLFSFNTFLSTCKNRAVSLMFAEKSQRTADHIGVLFVMQIDPSISSVPFAVTQEYSCFQAEEEVLFSTHAVFRIVDIRPMNDNNRLYQVNLTLTDDRDRVLQTLIEYTRYELQDLPPWHRLGKFLFENGRASSAEDLYNALLSRTNDINEQSFLYHQLGIVKNRFCEYTEALDFCQKSFEIRQETLREDDPNLADSYDAFGSIYNNMGECSKALFYHEKALVIRRLSLPSDHRDFIESYNNLGFVYNNMKDYPKALSYHEKALEIAQKILPSHHRKTAETYYDIGAVYELMEMHSKAIYAMKQAVDIGERVVAANDRSLQGWQRDLTNIQNNYL